MYEICSKLTIKTPGRRHHSGTFLINFEHISHPLLVFLLLTVNKQMSAGYQTRGKGVNYNYKINFKSFPSKWETISIKTELHKLSKVSTLLQMFAVSILKNASGKNTCFLLACTDAMVSDENFKNCRFNPLLRNVVKWSDTL